MFPLCVISSKNKYFGVCLYTSYMKIEIMSLNLCLAFEVANWQSTNTFCLPYCVLKNYEYVANV